MVRLEDLTENEIAWLRFLRDISNDSDPRPTLARVQLLRRVCRRRSTFGTVSSTTGRRTSAKQSFLHSVADRG